MRWLEAQPDGLLKDIGIGRSEIRTVVTRGRPMLHTVSQAE
jgi:uncharacterized protein YjiS (DUF1127 family)